jgi:hypothetical protein
MVIISKIIFALELALLFTHEMSERLYMQIPIRHALRAELEKESNCVNLTNVCKFYLQFQNVYALRKELSRMYYRSSMSRFN